MVKDPYYKVEDIKYRKQPLTLRTYTSQAHNPISYVYTNTSNSQPIHTSTHYHTSNTYHTYIQHEHIPHTHTTLTHHLHQHPTHSTRLLPSLAPPVLALVIPVRQHPVVVQVGQVRGVIVPRSPISRTLCPTRLGKVEPAQQQLRLRPHERRPQAGR